MMERHNRNTFSKISIITLKSLDWKCDDLKMLLYIYKCSRLTWMYGHWKYNRINTHEMPLNECSINTETIYLILVIGAMKNYRLFFFRLSICLIGRKGLQFHLINYFRLRIYLSKIEKVVIFSFRHYKFNWLEFYK